MPEELRIDKYLWAVRLYKTRTLASEACAKGQISIDGVAVKPSRHVKGGETMTVRKSPLLLSYKILKPLHTRLSAENVKEFIEDITPPEEYLKIEMMQLQKTGIRDRGTGRPTKRDRRDIDRHQDR